MISKTKTHILPINVPEFVTFKNHEIIINPISNSEIGDHVIKIKLEDEFARFTINSFNVKVRGYA